MPNGTARRLLVHYAGSACRVRSGTMRTYIDDISASERMILENDAKFTRYMTIVAPVPPSDKPYEELLHKFVSIRCGNRFVVIGLLWHKDPSTHCNHAKR